MVWKNVYKLKKKKNSYVHPENYNYNYSLKKILIIIIIITIIITIIIIIIMISIGHALALKLVFTSGAPLITCTHHYGLVPGMSIRADCQLISLGKREVTSSLNFTQK